jgi:hypothetical protein
MGLMVELPAELENELAEEARQFGLSLSAYVLRLLAAPRGTATPVRNGADLVAYWQKEGLTGTRPEIQDSQTHARLLREQAQKRTRP